MNIPQTHESPSVDHQIDTWDPCDFCMIPHQVTIPADAGFVTLTTDAVISSLRVFGGSLVTHSSTCHSGWTPAPGGLFASFGNYKCYRVFPDAASWTAAQSTCASAVSSKAEGTYGGALRGSLVAVEGSEENQWVERLCRGDSLDRDCWVGLTRSYRTENSVGGGGDFEWAELGAAANISRYKYRSWATREPSRFERDEVGTVDTDYNRSSARGCRRPLNQFRVTEAIKIQ